MNQGCLRRCMALFLVWGLAAPMCEAVAHDGKSAWADLPKSRARLIAANGLLHEGRAMLAVGLEITLEKGWKTYWRTPGDGLAPSLDWSRSGNLAGAEALWPVPQRFEGTGGVLSFGYKDRFMLPIRVVPVAADKAIRFELRVSYAVCDDICIPVEAELKLDVPTGAETPHRPALLAALERVPKKQERGVYCPHSFITAKRRAVNGKPALIIKTANEETATGLDLFAEAPEGVALPPPRRQPRATRGRLYHVVGFETEKELDALKGRVLTITMVADQGSCETTWRVE